MRWADGTKFINNRRSKTIFQSKRYKNNKKIYKAGFEVHSNTAQKIIALKEKI